MEHLQTLSTRLSANAKACLALAQEHELREETADAEKQRKRAHAGRFYAKICQDSALLLAEKAPDNLPTSEPALRICRLFHRRPTTVWTPEEIQLFKRVMGRGLLTPEDLDNLDGYYRSERSKPEGWHKRDLDTFLNNAAGEIDRARAWAAQNPRRAAAASRRAAARAVPEAPSEEPSGFRSWLATEYPRAEQTRPWEMIPEEVKERFQQ